MSTNWSVTVQVYASVGVLLAVAGVCISRLTKEANVMITIAQAIILTVGTALLGGADLVACFQLQRGECRIQILFMLLEI